MKLTIIEHINYKIENIIYESMEGNEIRIKL